MMANRRRFLTAAAGVSVASVTAGCTFFSDDDESEGSDLTTIEYDEYSETGDIYDHSLADYSGTPERHRWTDDPVGSDDIVLEIPFGEGVDHAGNAALPLDHSDLGLDTTDRGRAKRVYQQFQLYLPEDFELTDGDTLRFCFGAMSYSSGDAHSGGGIPDGTNGWSSRPYLTRRDAIDGTPAPNDGWHVGEYTYHMDQSSPEAGDESVFGNVVVTPGNWIPIETEVICNTWSGPSANADGVTRCWVDGNLAYEERGFRWATDESNSIELCGFTGYYWPGNDGSPTDQSIYFKDHAVSTHSRDAIVNWS